MVATHIRLAPRVADPEPTYADGVVTAVRDFLVERARQAERAGLPAERIVVDAGLDLGKTWQQSLELLRASDRLAVLGYPLVLSASNKTFLGRLLGLEVGERREASLAATALGVTRGCRIVRTHDVAGTRRVCDVVAAVPCSAPYPPIRGGVASDPDPSRCRTGHGAGQNGNMAGGEHGGGTPAPAYRAAPVASTRTDRSDSGTAACPHPRASRPTAPGTTPHRPGGVEVDGWGLQIEDESRPRVRAQDSRGVRTVAVPTASWTTQRGPIKRF